MANRLVRRDVPALAPSPEPRAPIAPEGLRLRTWIVALAAFFLGSLSVLLLAQTPSSAPAIATKTLMKEPLGELTNQEVSVMTLVTAPGAAVPESAPTSRAGVRVRFERRDRKSGRSRNT